MSIEKVENTKEKKLWFESVMGKMWGNKNANLLINVSPSGFQNLTNTCSG